MKVCAGKVKEEKRPKPTKGNIYRKEYERGDGEKMVYYICDVFNNLINLETGKIYLSGCGFGNKAKEFTNITDIACIKIND